MIKDTYKYRVRQDCGFWSNADHFLFMIVLIIICGCLPIMAFAGEVSIEQAKIVAQNWLIRYVQDHQTWAGSISPQVVGEETLKHDDLIVGYNFLIAPRGHIVVPVRDELPPVKLYSENVTLSVQTPGNLSEVLVWLQTEELFEPAQAFTQQTAPPQSGTIDWSATPNGRLWQVFTRDRTSFLKTDQTSQDQQDTADLGPLLTTKWNQGDPYNLFTPLWYNGEKTVTGCVATSAAQILKYWNHPVSGQNSTSYSWWNGQKYVTVSRDFSQSTYDWNNMTDTYSSGSSQVQKDAVARLMADVGIAWHMEYSPESSGAYTQDGLTIYPKYFKYKNTLKWVGRTSYASDSAWMQVFKGEIMSNRPCHFSMRDPSKDAGHAVVVDGYRDMPEEQIHINLGWGGSYDAWYVTNNIVTGKYNWSSQYYQSAIIGIEPNWICTTLGDLNCDGIFDAIDVRLELNCIFGRGSCDRADLNGDAIYDVFDLQQLINKIVK